MHVCANGLKNVCLFLLSGYHNYRNKVYTLVNKTYAAVTLSNSYK